MKKVIAGASLLLSGTLLFLSVCVASSNLGLIGGWDENGRFWNAISDNSLTPLVVLSIIIMLGGLAIMLWGTFSKSEADRK